MTPYEEQALKELAAISKGVEALVAAATARNMHLNTMSRQLEGILEATRKTADKPTM